MKLYRIGTLENVYYAATKPAARDMIKSDVPKHEWVEVVVEEVDMATDKANIVMALNGVPVYKVLNTFSVTVRGALKAE